MSLRIKIFICACIGICLILILRMYFLSIKSNVYFEKIAQRNTEKNEILAPTRGQIFDRNGELLATNELGFSVAINPFLRTEKTLQKALEFLVSYFPKTTLNELQKEYEAGYSPYNHSPIVVIPFVPYEEMQKIYSRLIQNPNIVISPGIKRLYPQKMLASHIIGYVGSANADDVQKNLVAKYTKIVGRLGLEEKYNHFLQGELGSKKTKVNAFNKEVDLLLEEPVKNGEDLTTSLDVRIQKILDQQFVGKNGSAIVMDVHNGEILAAGSYPEYDLNDFVGGIPHKKWKALIDDPHKPLLNKFSASAYPPGSVVKMGIALSFLEHAGIDEKTLIDTPAYVELGGRKFRDWKIGGHGKSDMIKAIKESVDVYFYLLSQKVGVENIAQSLKKMGFGEKTGIDLLGEKSGIMPTPEWKMRQYGEQWFVGDTINISIGQGAFLATPIQIARYTALLASGMLPVPHFLTQKGGEKVIYQTQNVLTPIQKQKLPAIALGMYQVCNSPGGTAYRYTKDAKVKFACKTGTAQVVGIPQEIKKRIKEEDMGYFHRSHGWITAFVPYRNPKYAITIFVEHGGGSGAASPILVNIVNQMFDMGYFKEVK
ncbi:penicillin-binding protein 2 [Helicobacter sp. faydin-H17]|nr:penicillin-binding protein 2 [Helicobacter kayseriensis]MCE3046724.1 penicillin-binding protein 2 [Helicobacter kayseriensis]MCE3047974.1 penicillin-binding protein 2 [Helicobacter kayseriensis]